MARALRLEFPGAFYHVYSRGIAKEYVFNSDAGRRLFVGILEKTAERYRLNIHAYCLMGNHYHLLIETPEGNLCLAMRQLDGVYGQAFNRLHSRVGPVFHGRYKACLVDQDAYLLELCRYIVLNPVRAKVVERPEQWPWSSYKATAGLKAAKSWLKTDLILGMIGGRAPAETRRRYREFISHGIRESVPDMNVVLHQPVLGTREFMNGLKERLEQKRDQKDVPLKQRFIGRPPLEQIFMGVKTKIERNRCIVKAHLQFGYPQRSIAKSLGLHFATLSRIIKNEEMSTYKT